VPLFRKAVPQDPLIIAMAGVRLGLRVLILVGDDAEMPNDVAAKVGLSGQVVAVGATEQVAARIEERAARRGVLVEPSVLAARLPYEDETFDLVIVDDRPQPAGQRTSEVVLTEAFRVLRVGGRLVALRAAPRAGLLGSRSVDAAGGTSAPLLEALARMGFRAAREIATREKTTFIEAARPG
jgi:ubiquinone/menaquinone biosynthesis C-methylase UbiE